MGEESMIIRRCLPEEELGSHLYELATRSFIHGAPWTRQQYKDTLSDKQLTFYVAEINGVIAGYIGGRLFLDEAEIYSVAVSPDYQNKEVATRLVRIFVEQCSNQAVNHIFLEVRESNKPARAFYEKMGFIEIGRRTTYYTHPVEDAILMKWTIGKLEQNEQ